MTGDGDVRETIFALSSGAPPAAIAIVRLSGPSAGFALMALAGGCPVPRMATLRTLRTPAGDMLDRALLLWFPGPASATGEDLAELHLHGGRAVIAAVLATLASLPDFRPALPGEFTRRAYANGRIDLAQAEALGDLLTAETERQRRRAIGGVEGALRLMVAGWRERIVQLTAAIEAELDFGEEGDVAVQLRDPRPALTALANEIAARRATPVAERLRDGLRVVIAGPPNSGKSSLLNALAGRDAAIVSDIAGTTRDRIEVPVALDGLPLVLIDTAGLHEGNDPIERIGIARAGDAIRAADILLWLGEPHDAPDVAAAQTRLILHPRADLPGRGYRPPGADMKVSIHGEGLDELRGVLAERATQILTHEDEILLNTRQCLTLRICEGHLRSAANAGAAECLAEELHWAIASLDSAAGGEPREAVIDAVFGRFCLGK